MQITARRALRAFTLIELIAVIVILAVLVGVAIPRFSEYAAKNKETAAKGALEGVRTAITNFHQIKEKEGAARYPTLNELATIGVVLIDPLPKNPYNQSNEVAEMGWTEERGTKQGMVVGDAGWNYDPVKGIFWANTNTVQENNW